MQFSLNVLSDLCVLLRKKFEDLSRMLEAGS